MKISDLLLQKRVKRLNRYAAARRGQGLNGIRSEEEFRKILMRERARVDRSGQQFSVAAFNTGRHRENGTLTGQLLRALTARLRCTDEIGWVDEQRIGALLHNTCTDGAWVFANSIRHLIAVAGPPPDCSVFTYPGGGPDVDNQDPRAGEQPHGKASRGGNGSGRTAGPSSSTTSNVSEDRPRTGQEFQPLLFRGMPVWKRCLDVVGSLLALLFLSPILLLAAFLVKIVSPGPVFFKQQRVGYMGKKFTMWKFRTMACNADTSDHQQYLAGLIKDPAGDDDTDRPMTKLDNNPQIIPYGRILRKSCLDELPQLINVLRGEMSLVGPRPPIPYEVEEYFRWHNGRFDAVPGMTGLWQVSGKNRLAFKEMIRLDIQYSRQRSLWLDLKILLITPAAIISNLKDGVLAEHRTEEGVTRNA